MDIIPYVQDHTELKPSSLRKISDSTTDSSPSSDHEYSPDLMTNLLVPQNCSSGLFTRPMSMDFPTLAINGSETVSTTSITRSKSSPSLRKVSLNDFKVKKLLGIGGYSKVVLAEHIETKDNYAIKVVEKNFMIKVNFEITYRKT